MTTVETATGATKTMVLNMGPQHPSTHGVLRLLLELDGETVISCQPIVGYQPLEKRRSTAQLVAGKVCRGRRLLRGPGT